MEREYRTAEGTQDAGGRHIEFAPIRLPAGRRIDYNRLRHTVQKAPISNLRWVWLSISASRRAAR